VSGILTRRHIRIKVLQTLYAHFRSDNENYLSAEKELFFSINKMYDMYFYYLLIFDELVSLAKHRIEEGKIKRLPNPEDLNPNLKFVENKMFAMLQTNRALAEKAKQRKINWVGEQDVLKKLFKEVRECSEYREYMETRTSSFEEDKAFAVKLFKKTIANFESLHQLFEERSVYWVDDIDLICSMVIKTLKQFTEASDEFEPLLPLYKEDDDEEEFAKILLRKTIIDDAENSREIDERTKNWEMDRIATMDVILMKMAITEAKEFNQIPLKVTLNEYIELSKFYSTPKSSLFINGILDKIFADMKKSGEIVKVGRGLID
jgi:transcription antitermination protein NusB